jgi:hypothetical protein
MIKKEKGKFSKILGLVPFLWTIVAAPRGLI